MKGITKDQVNDARNLLISQGQQPSVRKVRSILGTGSNQKIMSLLREISEEKYSEAVNDSPFSDGTKAAISDDVRNQITSACELIRSQLESEIENVNDLTQECESRTQELKDAEIQIENLRDRVRSLLAKNELLDAAAEYSSQESISQERQKLKLEAEHAALLKKCELLESDLREMEQAFSAARLELDEKRLVEANHRVERAVLEEKVANLKSALQASSYWHEFEDLKH